MSDDAYHGGDSKISAHHLVGEPVDFPPGVEEDDSLGDGESLIQIAKSVQLPFILTHIYEELCDT